MPLKVGDKAPDFTLVDTERKQQSLAGLAGAKTVIAFFPGAFTGTCTKEMCALRDSLSTLNSLNASVIAISVDSPFANKAFAEHNRLVFPVLSDFTRQVSKQYTGLHPDFAGLPGLETAKRSVFVLDAQRTVKYAWISENPGVEPDYEAITKALGTF